jgi:hypothetical protein
VVSVLLDEDYKSRYWLWNTGVTKEQLKSWWEGVANIEEYREHLGDLPGELIELMETDFIDEWKAFTHPGGNKTEKITLPRDIQGAHIAGENDSYLKIDGEYFYHKGASI